MGTYNYEFVAGGVGLAAQLAASFAGVAPLADFGGYIQMAIGLGNFFFLYKGNDNQPSDSNTTKISVGLVTVSFLSAAYATFMAAPAEEEWECAEDDEECEMEYDDAEEAEEEPVDEYGNDDYYNYNY